jgi:hypothetical protein
MPRSSKQGRGQYSTDVEFVDLIVSKEMEEQLKKSDYALTQWVLELTAIIRAGYKVTFKEDFRNAAVMVMVQFVGDGNIPSDVIWVLRSGTAHGGLIKLCWYWNVTDGTLPEPGAASEKDDSDNALFK